MKPWQWAATAGAVILALGAGVWALNQPRDQAPQEFAYNNDNAAPSPYMGSTGPGSSDFRPLDEAEAIDESPEIETAAAPARTTPAPRAPAPRQTAERQQEQPVIEQTIGVGPSGVTPAEDAGVSNAAYGDQEEVVVEGRRTLRPQWVRTPSEYRLSAAYPQRALERGREGEARVACIVENNGALDCDSTSEYPARSGFGAAAVRIAQSYRHAETRIDGAPAAGTPVNFHVIFRIEEERRRGA